MKNPRILTFFVLIFLCSHYTQAQNIWSYSPSIEAPTIKTVGTAADPYQFTNSDSTVVDGISLAIDTSGKFVYVLNRTRHIIRRIDIKNRRVQTIAGRDLTPGFSGDGGDAKNAHLNTPWYIVIDKNNNLYIADNGNNRVRKITLNNNIITTVVGSWRTTNACDDGNGILATNAFISQPGGLALDKYGNLYIAEWGSSHTTLLNACVPYIDPFGSRVWKLTVSTGILNSIAGFDGIENTPSNPHESIGPTNSFSPNRVKNNYMNQFSGIAVDDSLNVFFASAQSLIWKVSKLTGKMSLYAGWEQNITGLTENQTSNFGNINGGFNVPATNYKLSITNQIYVDGEGDLFICSGNKVLKVAKHSKILSSIINAYGAGFTFATQNGLPASAQTFRSNSLAFDKSDSVYLTSEGNGRVMAGSIKGGWRGSDYDFCKNTNWDNNVVPTGAMNALIGAIPSPNPWPIITCNVNLSNLRIKAGGILEVAIGGSLTADVITIEPGGSLIGKGTVNCSYVYLGQKLLPQRGWRVFANPFSSVKNIQYNANINFIKINTSYRYPYNPTLDTRVFNNSTNSWSNFTGADIASKANHAIFIRGTVEEATREVYTGGPSGIDYYASGTLLPLNSTVTIPAPTNANNFSLTGNPFAAPITSMALTGGVRRAYYVYQLDQGANDNEKRKKRGGWSPVLLSDTVTTIPVLGVIQWKQPAGTFNITTNDLRPRGTPVSNYVAFEKQLQHLELAVTDSGVTQDKLFVSVDAHATDKGTDFSDLEKISNTGLNIYTIAEDKTHLAVDTRSSLNTRIQLGITAENGSYNLVVNNNNLPEGTTVYLNDNFEHKVIDLSKKSNYSFSVNGQTDSKGDNRFSIQILQNKSTAFLKDYSNSVFKAQLFKNKNRVF